MSGHGAARAAAADAAARAQHRQLFMGLNAFDRHKKMMADLVQYYGVQLPAGGQVSPGRVAADCSPSCRLRAALPALPPELPAHGTRRYPLPACRCVSRPTPPRQTLISFETTFGGRCWGACGWRVLRACGWEPAGGRPQAAPRQQCVGSHRPRPLLLLPPPALPPASSAARRTTRATPGRCAWPSDTTGRWVGSEGGREGGRVGGWVPGCVRGAADPHCLPPARPPALRAHWSAPPPMRAHPRCSKLFKEYAIADLSRYKEGKVGSHQTKWGGGEASEGGGGGA